MRLIAALIAAVPLFAQHDMSSMQGMAGMGHKSGGGNMPGMEMKKDEMMAIGGVGHQHEPGVFAHEHDPSEDPRVDADVSRRCLF